MDCSLQLKTEQISKLLQYASFENTSLDLEIHRMMFFVKIIYLTWISGGKLCCSAKHTACRSWILLVVAIEGIRSMIAEGVWIIAT